MGSSEFWLWASHAGGRLISGILIALGIFFMVLAQYLHGRFSTASFILGICLVVLSLITAVLAFVADEPIRRG